ncbi:DNA polymerase III subunit gamma/tau [Shewanella gelidimarina]|uniref:DNA polymerase III subunit gamma/tau n=1 Tax=Shewanella gelidimarina TaxID=56813 RepID=UPI00200CC88F|nr:DNA polymerase III subunit gamma/tau [Shewanella gelidimarina]MCL1059098.1 DNA polymerase III subunit gamma/tau [Shewanella gelidimarina]
MSYQVLARKWRPAKFEQMVGQSHVLHALTNALTQQRLHHAYLFSGTRGVGKTSLARLFAKGLNCEQGVTATPCGECSACVEIAEGRFVDLIEVDAASRTKVDDTRELLDNVQYRPSRGRYKVYLIDEVHMLSRSSFNALLKTLEEPPEHVKFLLATTDPQRLPVTVLSRCLQFNLKSLTQDEIANQLANVLTQETLNFETSALTLLAKAANGSMRDALSLTDQAIAFGAGQVKLELVQTMLGSIDDKQVLVLLEALAKADIMALMQVSASVLSFGAEPDEVLRSLLELLHQITLTQFAPAAAQMSLYSEQIKAFAEQLSPEQVQLYYQLLLTGRKDLPHAPDPKSGLEMALLRAVTFVPEQPVTKWVTDTPAKLSIPALTSESITGSKQQEAGAEQAETKATSLNMAAEKKTLIDASDEVTIPVSVKTPETPETPETQEPKPQADIPQAATPVLNSLESMNSEMAVILSQAQSQGYSKSSESDLKAPLTKPQQSPLVEEGTATSNETIEVANTAVIVPSIESVPVPVPSKTNDLVIDSTITASHSANKSVAETASAEIATTEVTEAVQAGYEGEDDLSAYAQYAGAQDIDFDGNDFDFDTSNSAPLPQDTLSSVVPQERLASEQSTLVAQNETEKSDSTVTSTDLSDDILDAVLAARDSLLDGLGDDEPKESSTKKSVNERKPFAPPVRKPKREDKDAEGSSIDDDIEPLQQSKALAPVDNSSNIIDRPPWEEPHEQDPTPRFKDESAVHAAESPANVAVAAVAVPSQQKNETAQVSHKSTAMQLDSTSVQDVALNLPALPSGELSGNDIDLKWYRFMAELEVGGRVRQLAVNSVCHQFEQPLSLLLKPDQKHLAADVAIKQFEEAMSLALGEPSEVRVSVGIDSTRETPLEVRRRFHKEILAQAHHGLMTDANVHWLAQNMGAQLTPDTLSYAPELLVKKGKSIELVDMSNFKRLPGS